MKYAVGIDIGGTNTRVALIDDRFTIKERVQFSTNINDAYDTLKSINESIKTWNVDIQGIGVSCPGPLDLVAQKVLTPPNLGESWHNLFIARELSKLAKAPVYLENDANLAALAEAMLGAGKRSQIVQFLTISTGIGAGLCIDGEIYRGSKGFAQEVANCIVWKDGPYQGKLKKGSIESISSGKAIVKRALEQGLSVHHAGDVNDLAVAGNQIAQEIMNDAYEYLANFIGILYGVLDPDVFVIGGSVALKTEGFIQNIEKMVQSKVYSILKKNICIKKAELQDNSGLLGAACLVFKFQKNLTSA